MQWNLIHAGQGAGALELDSLRRWAGGGRPIA
jgi:hypothetical protein